MARLTRARERLSRLPPPAPLRERGTARERGYTAAWDRASKAFLASHPLCPGCRALGRVVSATLTDHVIPHRGDRALFWDTSNWQSSCDWHHNAVKQVLEERFTAGLIGADDLRLDSAVAVALAERMGRGV